MKIDHRPVLSSPVRSLLIQRRRIVRLEEGVEQLLIRNHFRVKHNLHALGMAGRSGADCFVIRRGHLAAGVAGDNFLHSTNLLKNGLSTPEAAGTECRQ